MESIVFREVQKISQLWWATLIILGATIIPWYGFIQQIIYGRPFGNKPSPNWVITLLWLLLGIGLPVLWFTSKLIVEVKDNHLYLRYVPFISRQIPLANIKHYQTRTYRPIREYGGWGIRGWGKHRAYNVSGNKGVELELIDGQKIMIGSQKPEELALAIATRRGR
ncbi:MAG: hypothetical protein JXM69_07060 [Anaerolineae bacterium]|nr:hypothetical protein [Anaerolineae bacterium]